MKTSNKLLLAVGLFILACLMGYNFALKKEYGKGEFRSPFYGMHKLNLADFKVINNQAANIIGIKIKHDTKRQVWVRREAVDMLKVTSDGHTLSVENMKLQQDNIYYVDMIIITCPEIDSVVTGGPVAAENQQSNDDYDPYLHTKIEGFTQPHLGVKANNRTLILLDNNKFDQLNTHLGDNKGGRGFLTITNSNRIGLADLNIKGKSVLRLYGRGIIKSSNHISDSASISLNRGALPLFLHAQNNPQ
jgi:hypothetical protein